MKLKIALFCCFFLLLFSAYSQSENTDYDFDEYIENPDTVSIDIKDYSKYTTALGGDSVRIIKDKPAAGLIKDYYPNGKIKHLGYYSKGKLTSTYKNFYSNGTLEREFKALGTSGGILNLFFSDAKPRLKIRYFKGNNIEYIEYYQNGNVAYHEKFDKRGEQYDFFKTFYPDGNLKMEMYLIDKKNNTYQEKIYWDNGNLKQEGIKNFNKSNGDYQKNGEWKLYLDSGKLFKIENYNFGDLEESK